MGDLKLVTFGTHPLLLRAGDSAVDRAPADGEALLVAALSDGAGASLPKPTAALAESAVRVRDAENDVALTLRRSISVPGQVQDSTTVKTLYQLSREHPENLLLNLESAIQGSLAGNDDAAAAVFLRIADHHPEFPEAVLAYADHLLWHRHAEMVPEQMLKLPAGSPLAIEGMWREVIARASELQFDIAARVLDQAPDYCTPPGRIFRDSRTSLRRLAELKDRVQANPDTASLRLAYGKTLAEYGLLEAAYQQLNQARLLDQGDPEPSLIMADYLLKQGKIEAARNAYSRAVESDRDNVRAVIGVADTWLAQDRRREALPALRRAVEVAPKDARIRYNLACVLASEGQVDDAATELERAVQLGYSDWDRITGDQDLEKVRATETYRRIVAKAPPRR
jgi:Flp pilus assembly protein TadD